MPKKKKELSPKISKNAPKLAKNYQNREIFFWVKFFQYFTLFSPKKKFPTIIY